MSDEVEQLTSREASGEAEASDEAQASGEAEAFGEAQVPGEAEAFDEAEQDLEAQEPSKAPQPRKRRWWLLVLFVLLACVAIAAGLFAWDRWWRFNDAADIQGVWHDSNGAQVVIDESRMLLGNRVIYDFTLDTKNKTITYTYDDYVGHASYRFSGDRQVLVLQENATTDWLMALHLKEDEVLLYGTNLPEGCTRLTRQAGNPQELFDAFASKDRSKTPTTSDSSEESGQEDLEVSDQIDANSGTENYDDMSYYDDGTYQDDTSYTEQYSEEDVAYDQSYDQSYDSSYDQSYDQSYNEMNYEDYSYMQEE